MNAQLSINFEPASFLRSRSRRNDCDTSKAAAKNAVTGKASRERIAITAAIKAAPGGLTAYEVADLLGLDRHVTSRRISECGLIKTELSRPNADAEPGKVGVAV